MLQGGGVAVGLRPAVGGVPAHVQPQDRGIRIRPHAVLGPLRREADRHARVAAHLRRVHALEAGLVDREIRRRRKDLLQGDACLEPCERRAEAGVGAAPKPR